MNSKLAAIGISLAVHALIAAAIVVYLEYVPTPDAIATLDISSVELSFAEKEDDSAAVSSQPPSPTPSPISPPPPTLSSPITPHPPPPPTPPPPPHHISHLTSLISYLSQLPHIEEYSAPRQAKLDAPARPLRNIRPDYPKGARQRGEQGRVTVEIAVDAEGAVGEARVVTSCGFADLDAAALKAVRAARFNPARRGSESVASTVHLTLNFKLR